MNCKAIANSLQSVFKLCAISENFVCKHRNTDKNALCCSFRVAFIAFMPSPVYCTSLRKTSLLYKCTQSQFTVKVYTKPVYCPSVHKIATHQNCRKEKKTEFWRKRKFFSVDTFNKISFFGSKDT